MLQIFSATFVPNIIKFGQHLIKLLQKWKGALFYGSQCRFTSTLNYLKIRKFISYWSLDAVNMKKSLIITGMTNWNWIKFGAGFLLCFSAGFTQKAHWFFWYYVGVWTLVFHVGCLSHRQTNSNQALKLLLDTQWLVFFLMSTYQLFAHAWLIHQWHLSNEDWKIIHQVERKP